jgi:penicillin-binding protein 1C
MFATAALQRRAFDASEGVAPHAARQALREARADTAAPGGSLRTTLHAPLQRFAVQTLTQQLRELRGRQVEDGAIVVLDNRTGEVLAWVGSSGALSRAREVDAVLAPRQPGSTLKPFLYAQAIAEQRLTAASLLEDSAAHIPTASGLYIPQNYDRSFKGWVSARTALAASLNVPAVRTLVMVSPDAFFRQLQQMGLPLRESGDYFGYSLALGSAEVSLLALTNTYRTLANGGRAGPVAPLVATARPAAPPPSVQVVDARAAFIVGDILSDGLARARTFSTDSVLATRFWTAVKTGTSKDMRDNWAMGWSQHYTVGVWVGNASGAPMWDVSGTSGAAPIWAAVMQHLHVRVPSRAPVPPPGLVQAQVQFGQALEAPRSEWFLQGTQQAVFAIDSVAEGGGASSAKGQKGLKNQPSTPSTSATGVDASGATAARITEPATGTIIALDPDIPPNRQRLRLAAQGQDLRWRIDGKDFAKGNQTQWLPWPGRHRITLVDAQGRVLDEVRVEVRGAGVK